jgi:hypothetical protein
MTLPKQIRETLASGPIPFRELHEKIGGADDKLMRACSNLAYKSELTIGNDEDKTITLKSRRTAPPQGRNSRPGKKSAGKKAKRAGNGKRPYKRLADRHAGKGANGVGLKDLVLANYLAAGAELRAAVKNEVEGFEDNPVLVAAIAHHERAEQIHDATRAA